MVKATIKAWCPLLVAGTMLTACSGDDSTTGQKDVMETGKTYFMSVKATKGGNGEAARATRALTMGDNRLVSTWAIGEKVYLSYDNNVQFDGCLQPTTADATTTLNGDIKPTTTLWLPIKVRLLFPRKEWSYDDQAGTLENIAANYDYATTTADISNVDGSHVEASKSVEFANEQAIVQFTLKDDKGADLSVSSLRISAMGLKAGKDATGDITVTPASATNVVYAALRGISNSPRVTLTATAGSDTYIYNRSNVTFGHGKYYPITVKMHKVAPVALANATTDHIGWVVGTDGWVYANASDVPTGFSAVAMIAYVGAASHCEHGLAVGLADEDGQMGQEAASSAASSRTAIPGVSGGGLGWRLPSLQDWQYMFMGCGNGETYNNANIPAEVDGSSFNSKLATAGHALMSSYQYWSSHPSYYYIAINGAKVTFTPGVYNGMNLNVRAVLAF